MVSSTDQPCSNVLMLSNFQGYADNLKAASGLAASSISCLGNFFLNH